MYPKEVTALAPGQEPQTAIGSECALSHPQSVHKDSGTRRQGHRRAPHRRAAARSGSKQLCLADRCSVGLSGDMHSISPTSGESSPDGSHGGMPGFACEGDQDLECGLRARQMASLDPIPPSPEWVLARPVVLTGN